MGVAGSKNVSTLDVFNNTVSENLNQSMVSIAQQSISTVAPTQVIKIRAAAGRDFTLSGIDQKVVVNVDIQKFLSNVNETQLKSMMKSALETAAKDNQAIEHQLVIGGSYAANQSSATVRNTNVNRIVNSYSYSQFVSEVQTILPAQTVDLSGTAMRDVNISNVSQYVKIDLISKQIAESMSKAFNDIQTESTTSVKKEANQATTAGISLTGMWIIIVIIVVIAAAGLAAFYFWGGGKEMLQEQLAQSSGGGGGGGGSPKAATAMMEASATATS